MSESGTQLLARLDSLSSLIGHVDVEPRLFPEGLTHGHVVELMGAQGTGKSEVLYHLLCRCVLPVCVGGLEVEVVFVDTDSNLDLFRLVSVLDHKLLSAPSPSDSSHDALLSSCLQRLLVVQSSSSSQLLLTLHFLENSLSSRPGLSLLIIDSISAFYWLDRLEGGASVSRQEDKLSRCAELLGRFLRDYRVTVLASVHPIRRRSFSGGPSFLCRAWQRLVTQQFYCCRTEGEPANFTVTCSKTKKSCSFRVTHTGLEFI